MIGAFHYINHEMQQKSGGVNATPEQSCMYGTSSYTQNNLIKRLTFSLVRLIHMNGEERLVHQNDINVQFQKRNDINVTSPYPHNFIVIDSKRGRRELTCFPDFRLLSKSLLC